MWMGEYWRTRVARGMRRMLMGNRDLLQRIWMIGSRSGLRDYPGSLMGPYKCVKV